MGFMEEFGIDLCPEKTSHGLSPFPQRVGKRLLRITE